MIYTTMEMLTMKNGAASIAFANVTNIKSISSALREVCGLAFPIKLL